MIGTGTMNDTRIITNSNFLNLKLYRAKANPVIALTTVCAIANKLENQNELKNVLNPFSTSRDPVKFPK